jgi:hypothetical protein
MIPGYERNASDKTSQFVAYFHRKKHIFPRRIQQVGVPDNQLYLQLKTRLVGWVKSSEPTMQIQRLVPKTPPTLLL